MSAADARAAAARIVGRVVREGAYSNVVSRVETSGLNPSDRGLAHALAFDTIRYLAAVDAAIADVSTRPLDRIDPHLLDLLRVGTMELGRGDRPDALIVDATVTAAKRLNRSYAGFANGVLRSLGRRKVELHVEMPPWLREELSPAMSPTEIEDFWRASLETPSVGVRSETEPPEGGRPVQGIEGAWLVDGAVAADTIVQDPASVAVGASVGAQPGERILDMAAAPGGKTRHLLDRGAEVVAIDIHPRRVADARRRAPGAHWVLADGRRLPFGDSAFDAVLVDAPCTGLGTLRRRPEIIHRMGPADVRSLAETGSRLLAEARRVTKPGGRIVYSVCTITPVESIDVVAGLGARPPLDGLPGRAYGDGWLLAPHLGPTDGMFIARIDV